MSLKMIFGAAAVIGAVVGLASAAQRNNKKPNSANKQAGQNAQRVHEEMNRFQENNRQFQESSARAHAAAQQADQHLNDVMRNMHH